MDGAKGAKEGMGQRERRKGRDGAKGAKEGMGPRERRSQSAGLGEASCVRRGGGGDGVKDAKRVTEEEE